MVEIRLVLGISMVTFISVVTSKEDIDTLRNTAQKWYETHKRLSSLVVGLEENCTANQKEGFSWFLLNSMFERSLEKNQGLLRTAWTRIDFYKEHLPLLYDSNTTFCKFFDFWDSEWTPVACFTYAEVYNETYKIPKGLCRRCTDSKMRDWLKEFHVDIRDSCAGEERLPPENKLREKEVKSIEDLRKEYKKPIEFMNVPDPEFIMDFEEFWAFRKILKDKSKTLKDFELCDDSIEVTLSLGYMYAMLDAEVRYDNGTENEEATKSELREQWDEDKDLIQEKLKWLKGTEEAEISCKWGQFCGPDTVCIDCNSVVFPIEYEDICGSKQKIKGNWEQKFTYGTDASTTTSTTTIMTTTKLTARTTTEATSSSEKGKAKYDYRFVIFTTWIAIFLDH